MHEALRKELRRQGLPARCVTRLVAELADHLDELYVNSKEAKEMSTVEELENRLGEPEVLAQMAVAEHWQSYFVGRHPLWCCVVAPIPLTIICWAICLLSAVGLADVLPLALGERFQLDGRSVSDWPPLIVTIAICFPYFMRFVPPILATLFVSWQIRRAGLSLRWSLISWFLIAAVAGGMVIQMHLPQTPGTGTLELGLGIPFGVRAIIQAAVPLATGLLIRAWTRGRAVAETGT
jgi:hypothetical protein